MLRDLAADGIHLLARDLATYDIHLLAWLLILACGENFLGRGENFIKVDSLCIFMKKKKEDNSGLFIPAGLFLGLGFGALYGQWTAGVMFGLGFGFLAMGVARVLMDRKQII